jgi:hypothetical protein
MGIKRLPNLLWDRYSLGMNRSTKQNLAPRIMIPVPMHCSGFPRVLDPEQESPLHTPHLNHFPSGLVGR